MLDGGAGGTLAVADAGDVREEDWQVLHRKLCMIARERTQVEAMEIGLRVEAEEAQLHLRLGYATFRELMERELGWTPHAANERLRVAHELLDLPVMQEVFESGELLYSIVRELTRVATDETEMLWLAKAEGKTVRQVEQMVKGRKKGDVPEDAVDPSKILERVVFEVTAATHALMREARAQMERDVGHKLSDDEFVNLLARGGGGGGGRDGDGDADGKLPRPGVQHAVTTCRECRRGWLVGGGDAVELPAAELECALCDTIYIGDLETDELTRPRSDVPAAIRRKSHVRDKGRCTVPGCRSRRHLQVHHVVHREDGGEHTMVNVTWLCGAHHRLHHRGLLEIMGSAPDLTFRRKHDHDPRGAGPPGDRVN